MWWETISRWPGGVLARLTALRWRSRRLLALGLSGTLALTVLIGVAASVMTGVFAAPTNLVSPSATCAQLARADQTATNGSTWGETMLPGHNAAGGWFGVDVCSNGISSATVGGSNISCDHLPSNWARTGCAPGNPTNDGYGWSFQCVELVIRFSAWAYGDAPGDWIGNAPDLWLPGNHPSDYVLYPNGSTHAPVPGDILVWGSLDANGNPWPAGPDGQHGGHIGIVAAVRDGMVITAEQNVKWGTVDHPSDTLALSDIGGRWILSGSATPASATPTYRWMRTMGHERATYGWLHSTNNTGVFPSPNAGSVRSTPGASKTPTGQYPGGLPALTSAVVIAGNGALADLTWSSSSSLLASSDSSVSAPAQSDANAQSAIRNLGSPPNTQLRPNQSAATVSLANGVRYSYVIGSDGKLYVAQTSPSTLGVFWAALGAPDGIHLVGSASASLIATGVVVAAVGSDGQLWLRRGSPNTLGAWEALGKPANTPLAGGFAVAGAPGEGAPLLLTIGADGKLYERLWLDALYNSDGSVAIPSGWSAWTPISIPASVAGAHGAPSFTGALLAAPETPGASNFLGSWPDTALNLFVLASDGSLWRLRATTILRPWQITLFSPPTTATRLTSLLGTVAVASPTATTSLAPAPTVAAPAPSALHLYLNTSQGAYLLVIPPVSAQASAAGKPQWTQLAALPQVTSPGVVGVALPLATGLSALILASGAQVLVGGASDATGVLLPNGASGQSAFPTPTPNANGDTPAPWLSLGVVMAPVAFADSFAGKTLDTRWTLTDPNAQITASPQGLRIQPSAPAVMNGQTTGQQALAALLQRARAGDGALSVEVTPGTTGAAGLILFLDQSDWVTLLADRAGVVTYCAMVWGQAHPCSTKTITPAQSGALWLRLTRAGVNYTAAASADNAHWTLVAPWAPVWPGATRQHAGAHTTNTMPVSLVAGSPNGSIAPLAFTCWGVVAEGQDASGAGPLFSDFGYTQR